MLKIARTLWKNEYYQGGVLVTISFTIANILNYLFNFIVARSLGPAGYSEIVTLFSYLTTFSVPISVISIIITQKVSAGDEKGYAIAIAIEQFFWKTIAKLWYLLIPVVIVTPFLPAITNLSVTTSLALMPLIIALIVLGIYQATIQGLRLFLLFAITVLMMPAIKLIGALISLLGGGLHVVVIFLFLSVFLTCIVNYAIYYVTVKSKHVDSTPGIDRSLMHILTSKQFLITTVSILAITLFSNVDIIFVKKFFSAEEAGIYGSWSLFGKIILYALGPLTAVGFIFFSSKKHEQSHNRALMISLLLLLVVGVISFLFYTYFAKVIINILFGHKFFAVSPYLRQASIFGSLYAAITFINNYYLAKKSNVALILPIFIIFYIAALFVLGNSLLNIMNINIYFSGVILLLYLAAYFKSLYNAK